MGSKVKIQRVTKQQKTAIQWRVLVSARKAKRDKDDALHRLASQVAHDIRSPLSALSLVCDSLTSIPAEHRLLIQSAVTRIQDIANNLLPASQPVGGKRSVATVEQVSGILETLLSEKRTQFRLDPHLELRGNFGPKAYGLFSRFPVSEFKKFVSDLVDSLVMTIQASGAVELNLEEKENRVCLTLSVQGAHLCGVEALTAAKIVAAWDGEFRIDTTNGGNAIRLLLPKAAKPSWFLPSLKIQRLSTVLVVDDDPSIHHTWNKKLAEIEPERNGVRVHHFFSGKDLSAWMAQSRMPGKTVCLMDYEFAGSRQNGLQILESLGLNAHSILVTSHAEEGPLLEDCNRAGIPVLPKALVSAVPVALVH